MEMALLQAALFDFDGTLANTDDVHLACWNLVLEKYAAVIDAGFYAQHCAGALTQHIAAQIAQYFPKLPIVAGVLAQEKDQQYEQWVRAKPVDLLPGARELLVYLYERHIPSGIVTGAPLAAIQKTLEDHTLLPFFSIIVTREAVARGKPAPDGYLLGMQGLGASARHAVSFEDTSAGVLAARAAGMSAFAIPGPFTRGQDFSAADVVCQDLFEARRVLAERNWF
jgi:beta-phosphoglucomutase